MRTFVGFIFCVAALAQPPNPIPTGLSGPNYQSQVNAWFSWLNSNKANVTVASSGSVLSYTANHTIVAGDCGNWLTMNGSSLTLTLASPPTSTTCSFAIQNLAATSLTIARNGLTINGVASNLTLAAISGAVAQELSCWTNGTNYFCSQGPTGPQGPPGGGGGSGKIDYQLATSTITGNNTVYTTTVPGGTMASGECIRAAVSTNSISTVSTPLFDICFGATCVGGMYIQPATGWTTSMEFEVCNNPSSTTAQHINAYPVTASHGGDTTVVAGFNGPVATPAEDTANDVVLLVKMISGGGADTMKGWWWHVWGPM